MSKSTLFILAGGNDLTTEGYGSRLAAEVVNHISHPRILSCFFAVPEEDWPAKYQKCKNWLAANFSDFTYDYAKKATFLKQIEAADVVYLHGGDTQLLFDALPAVDQLKEQFEGKIVIGSSAGANVLSKNYWSSSRAVPAHGLGVVDVNIMVHYGALSHDGRMRISEDWVEEEAKFQSFIGDGKITRLPEGEFVIERR